MSRLTTPDPVVGFLALLLSAGENADQAVMGMEAVCGKTSLITDPIPFDYTAYYEKEMGPGLLRVFCFYDDPMQPEKLVEQKLFADGLEKRIAPTERRIVNIDPGYYNLDQVALSTGKYAQHRMYLGKGVYGDVELIFKAGSFQALPWTYPDYRSPEVIELFNDRRRKYRDRLRVGGRQEQRI